MDDIPDQAFSNQAVDPDTIPDYGEAPLRGVAATFRRYTLVATALAFLPPLLVFGAAALAPWQVLPPVAWLALPVVAAAGLLTGSYRWIDAGFRGYAVREHDVLARSGILWRDVTALPIARIQHVETTHGPVERWHGLARLKLYTAGGLTADLVIVGLERETADQLREYLVEQIRLRDDDSRRHE